MVVQTFPLIGNYGVIPADFESDAIGPCAYIVKQWCQAPSNFRSQGSLDTFFKEKGVIGLSGIDTRTLTKIIRETGVMNGVITDDPAAVDFEALKAYRVTGAVKASSTKERYVVRPEGEVKKKIALLDFGLKRNIYRELVKRGAEVTVCPCTTTAGEIKALGVDGIMLSNGPGDPAENVEIIANLKEICKLGIPLFGICLGHQLLALAHGFRTEKLKYGHRGANQPVKNLETGRCTSPARTTATRWCPPASTAPWPGSCSSTSTTTPARASAIWTAPPFPCSSTPKPAAVPWTPRPCSMSFSL